MIAPIASIRLTGEEHVRGALTYHPVTVTRPDLPPAHSFILTIGPYLSRFVIREGSRSLIQPDMATYDLVYSGEERREVPLLILATRRQVMPNESYYPVGKGRRYNASDLHGPPIANRLQVYRELVQGLQSSPLREIPRGMAVLP